MKRDDVLEQLRDLMPRLRQEHGVEEVRLYGSVARGEETAGSDVDLLVEFQGTPTLFQMARLKRELEDRLGRPVDITTRGGLRPRTLERALQDAVPV